MTPSQNPDTRVEAKRCERCGNALIGKPPRCGKVFCGKPDDTPEHPIEDAVVTAAEFITRLNIRPTATPDVREAAAIEALIGFVGAPPRVVPVSVLSALAADLEAEGRNLPAPGDPDPQIAAAHRGKKRGLLDAAERIRSLGSKE